MSTALTPTRPLSRALALAWAWTGGIAFVASLLYFLYFYFVLPSRTPPEAPAFDGRALAIDVGLFAVFGLHHSVMARTRAKQRLSRLLPSSLERTCYVWIASALFFGLCWWWQPLPGRAYRLDGALAWCLLLTQFAGILVALRSARTISIFDLAGIRQAHRGEPALSDHAAAHEMARLETTGPYRAVRHPIYTGWLLIVFAAPDMTINRLAFATLSLAYLVIGIPFEERSLLVEFGAAYREYARKVRWRMVPGLY
jgi:protein-S-isoprenylcysteine O-methyltransferase Ste14